MGVPANRNFHQMQVDQASKMAHITPRMRQELVDSVSFVGVDAQKMRNEVFGCVWLYRQHEPSHPNVEKRTRRADVIPPGTEEGVITASNLLCQHIYAFLSGQEMLACRSGLARSRD